MLADFGRYDSRPVKPSRSGRLDVIIPLDKSDSKRKASKGPKTPEAGSKRSHSQTRGDQDTDRTTVLEQSYPDSSYPDTSYGGARPKTSPVTTPATDEQGYPALKRGKNDPEFVLPPIKASKKPERKGSNQKADEEVTAESEKPSTFKAPKGQPLKAKKGSQQPQKPPPSRRQQILRKRKELSKPESRTNAPSASSSATSQTESEGSFREADEVIVSDKGREPSGPLACKPKRSSSNYGDYYSSRLEAPAVTETSVSQSQPLDLSDVMDASSSIADQDSPEPACGRDFPPLNYLGRLNDPVEAMFRQNLGGSEMHFTNLQGENLSVTKQGTAVPGGIFANRPSIDQAPIGLSPLVAKNDMAKAIHNTSQYYAARGYPNASMSVALTSLDIMRDQQAFTLACVEAGLASAFHAGSCSAAVQAKTRTSEMAEQLRLSQERLTLAKATSADYQAEKAKFLQKSTELAIEVQDLKSKLPSDGSRRELSQEAKRLIKDKEEDLAQAYEHIASLKRDLVKKQPQSRPLNPAESADFVYQLGKIILPALSRISDRGMANAMFQEIRDELKTAGHQVPVWFYIGGVPTRTTTDK